MQVFNNRLANEDYQPKSIARFSYGSLNAKLEHKGISTMRTKADQNESQPILFVLFEKEIPLLFTV